ncbi:hypothetical protein [Rickettsiales endosymbiont of Peranema trichophorum]|uniref:hypothetical protein n=1 Tax=Rickettsiales endosymbiont of Peranema trichophorum TaxID=2486577 RepID=UPI001F5DD57A|nr:hypothetical protein [Rickettsiales endosymbiont of Peranema trichophorum]
MTIKQILKLVVFEVLVMYSRAYDSAIYDNNEAGSKQEPDTSNNIRISLLRATGYFAYVAVE